MTRFDPKAIIIAMLLSLALDVVGSMVLLAFFGSGLSEGMSSEQLNEAILAIAQGRGFLLASLVYGSATTAFGGYVAARLARGFPYFNALAVGVIGIALGLLLSSGAPWWFDALAYVISVPAAVAGARVFMQRTTDKTSGPPR